ncbi:MAG: C4-dicarboxylate TRAP transporter substrate-binding protein [Pseudomonadota bacterium]
MKTGKLISSLCVGLAIALGAVSGAAAREIKLGVGLAPGGAPYHGLEIFSKTVKEKSAGELEVKLYPLSLLSLSQMFAGIRDGIVDGGFFLQSMTPAEWPDTQLGLNLAMLGTNPFAMAGAATEYNFTCQECLAERLKFNHVYLGSASTGALLIMSTKKISTLDELKGKKLRTAGAAWARWAQNTGAVSMTISPNEVFEVLSQGTVDGVMMTPTELSALRLIDVVKHITPDVPGGTFHGLDNHNFNRASWKSLTDAQRRVILDSAAMSSAAITLKYISDGSRNMKDAQQKGIQIHRPAADFLARSKALGEADVATVTQAAEKAGVVKNVPAKVARFRQLVEKWEKLTPNRDNWDANELAEIYRREIFSKIDAKTYGQ